LQRGGGKIISNNNFQVRTDSWRPRRSDGS
jgi:hypothetical protein